MENTVLSNHRNWIFISFVKGSFGNLLGRTLMTGPDTTWYDHPVNGRTPWEWNHFQTEVGWGVSPSHFAKFFKTGDTFDFDFLQTLMFKRQSI